MRWVGIAAFEAWLITKLLRSPGFNKAVRRAHRKYEEVRTGQKLYDPEDFSGLHIDKPGDFKMQKFFKHFKDELKDQFRGQTKK